LKKKNCYIEKSIDKTIDCPKPVHMNAQALSFPSRRSVYLKRIVIAFTYFVFLAVVGGSACNPTAESLQSEDNDIGGVVTGPNGPEAGVWVIAETYDLPTRYAKIVVTHQ
jgi:hypothetical protein